MQERAGLEMHLLCPITIVFSCLISCPSDYPSLDNSTALPSTFFPPCTTFRYRLPRFQFGVCKEARRQAATTQEKSEKSGALPEVD
ncbi:uncharacterized protein LY89DRAFT_36067 [Mollisia scopiformis]|uniref:Secreted protein n=1 Tax=Mollisia scopiformis TaxID=149040 RepID=A0A194XCZ9_MOLSC|nr:uncharacterized protein LY89DRAFT_36067 [Mollisia scopiformis]KUJ18048.1 hypothetical protein LY89DRAFT_36067 [Mollisia scopiformis]